MKPPSPRLIETGVFADWKLTPHSVFHHEAVTICTVGLGQEHPCHTKEANPSGDGMLEWNLFTIAMF
jgi:hypothetical protein